MCASLTQATSCPVARKSAVNPFAKVSLNPDAAALRSRHHAALPVGGYLLRRGVQHALANLAGHNCFGGHLLAPDARKRDSGCLLVAAVVALYKPLLRGHRAVFQDVAAHGIGADCGHVLTGRFAAGIFKNGKHLIALHVDAHIVQYGVVAMLRHDCLKLSRAVEQVKHERTHFAQVLEAPDGRSLNAFGGADGGDAAAEARCLCAAGITGYQGRLRSWP